MKKIKLLSMMLLMSAVAMAADYTGIQLTFKRTGSTASDVAVTVSDQKGNALSGVTASLESMSFDALKAGSAEALTNGSVLAPDSYANQPNSEITYLFKVEGLDGTFSFSKADIDVYAMNAGGAPQNNDGSTVRTFQFFVSTGNTSSVTPFAEKTQDTDICTVTNEKGGLRHSIQTMTAGSEQTATDPLYIQVTLKKTAELGCYAGIGMVKLYKDAEEVDPDPDPETGFSADKFYIIRRNGNASSYIHQNGSKMGTGKLETKRMCWWIFEPTGNENRYYIKNATTGKYVQSSANTELSTLVPMGEDPVEFEIKKDETAGASTKGFYYLASTDQTITTVGDVTQGLNLGSSGVVAYWIKSGRGNSYWEIYEDEYRYAPSDIVSTDYAKSVQMYSIPCGSTGKAYLGNVDIEGDDIVSELHYSASSAPREHHIIFMDQKIDVKRGGTLPLNVTIARNSSEIRAFAYADWDKNGVFEVTQEIFDGTASFTVPADAQLGQYRLRIRVTEDNTEGPEADVIGACYDFILNVVEDDKAIEWTVEVNDETRGKVTAEEVGGTLKASVTTYGDAVFKGWKLMHSYFKGEMVGTDTEIELPLTQSIRLVAILSPNTKDVPTGVNVVETEETTDGSIYTLEGIKVGEADKSPQLRKGIYIIDKKKKVIR